VIQSNYGTIPCDLSRLNILIAIIDETIISNLFEMQSIILLYYFI